MTDETRQDGPNRPKAGIYLMDELDDALAGMRPSEVAATLDGGDGTRFDASLPYLQIVEHDGTLSARSLDGNDGALPRFPERDEWRGNLSGRAFDSIFGEGRVALDEGQYEIGAKAAARHSDIIPRAGHYVCSECGATFIVAKPLLKERVAYHMLRMAVTAINGEADES